MAGIKKNIEGKNKNGFSLIEVLIGMLILAFGLLAVGGMQVVSIKIRKSSYRKD